jgi:hypothetical protein
MKVHFFCLFHERLGEALPLMVSFSILWNHLFLYTNPKYCLVYSDKREIPSRFLYIFSPARQLSLSNSYSAASIHLSVRPSICQSFCLSINQASFVNRGQMWTFFQLVPLGHLTEPSFSPIQLTAWPPGGRTWKSKQSAISPELSIGLSPYFYLKYRRLAQYIFHSSVWFNPLNGALPPNYNDRQAANRFWISRGNIPCFWRFTKDSRTDDVVIMAVLFSVFRRVEILF